MFDPLLKLHREKMCRMKRVGDWKNKNLTPLLDNHNITFINLEIGCGHGHWLSTFAKEKPEEVFVGVDLISKRIQKAESKVIKQHIKNLLFYKAEATEFLDFVDPKLRNTFVMYPDPWPKYRHRKRRLLQHAFLELLACKTVSKGKLFFMTDHNQYFDWSINMIINSKLWELSGDEWPHNGSSFFSEILPRNRFFCANKI
tara:strand:- start:176 stop:775 length:600 start_codon:yes stop_codon:yes gene_type:complete